MSDKIINDEVLENVSGGAPSARPGTKEVDEQILNAVGAMKTIKCSCGFRIPFIEWGETVTCPNCKKELVT